MSTASNTTRRTARALATRLLGTGTAKLCLAGVASFAAVTVVLLAFGMIITAAQATAAATTSDLARQDIPPIALDAYQKAATNACPGLDWSILAGIGKVESDHGRTGGTTLQADGTTSKPILGPPLDGSGVGGNRTAIPVGQWRGRWGLAGDYQHALGPMQFLPDTFARHAPSAAASPHNIYDATRAAANYLCAGGITAIATAIRRYNNSTTYVDQVLHWAALYRSTGGTAAADAQALIDNPNIQLTTAAEGDLRAGIVDPRLVQLLNQLAVDHHLAILNFRTGHPRCKVLPNTINAGPNCKISNHWDGRATDITAVSLAGQSLDRVSGANGAARVLVQSLALMPIDSPVRPDEVGSSWAAFEDYPGHFSNELHQDHIHVGWNP